MFILNYHRKKTVGFLLPQRPLDVGFFGVTPPRAGDQDEPHPVVMTCSLQTGLYRKTIGKP